MNILILGNGYLAQKYHKYFHNSLISKARINCTHDVLREIELYLPDVIINCIGKTGRPNIDWCEDNKAETLFSNLNVPLMIQWACAKTGVKMVHIGTGCIFEGHHRSDDDIPDFVENYYGKTKYLAEQALSDFDVLQLRVRMPIDPIPHPRNLLTKLLSYDKTISEYNSITILPDLMKATDELLQVDATGIFNMVNPDAIKTTDILNIYNQYSPNKKEIKEIFTTRLYDIVKAPRSNCTLSTNKLNGLGIYMRKTKESLQECIKEYVEHEVAHAVL